MTFYKWLLNQKNRDGRIGDLSKDVQRDKDFPRGSLLIKQQRYIAGIGCDEALETLIEAQDLWAFGYLCVCKPCELARHRTFVKAKIYGYPHNHCP